MCWNPEDEFYLWENVCKGLGIDSDALLARIETNEP
jgi:hypothetical protein